MFKKEDVLCVVCSAGGHLTEAKLATASVQCRKYFVTYELPHIEETLRSEEVYFISNPHTHLHKYPKNFLQSLWLYLRKNPKFILTTGSGVGIATCLIGKIFGSKIIYVETGARTDSPSRTGRVLYRIADLFIVQWRPLLKRFPKALYGGLLF
jgi:beta-1,4-N-acetylglucosaminyltransferase